MSRLQVVQDVIASGVVAVIRMKDPSKLKGVAGNTFTTSAPACHAVRISVGVKQPGIAATS